MVMIFGQMNEPPGSRFRVGHAALTMAEYFRDDEHRDVLLLIDNIFRFIQAGMEVSGLMGQMPSRLGYQPTMGTELSELEERIANTDSGAITSIQAVYVPADDFTDPAAVHTFSHLSASIVLSRKRASEGLFPAIDPLQSSSKMATPGIVGDRHYRVAQEIRKTLAQYSDLKDIIAMLGMEQLSPENRKVVDRARKLERFLTQPFFTTEQFTGLKGCRRVYFSSSAAALLEQFPTPILTRRLWRQWSALRIEAKIPDVSLHDLRRTFASWGINHGHDGAAIHALQGHSLGKVQSAYQIYADPTMAQLAERIGEALATLLGIAVPKPKATPKAKGKVPF
jgi:hypothetical protein